jgi:hypothetical protein
MFVIIGIMVMGEGLAIIGTKALPIEPFHLSDCLLTGQSDMQEKSLTAGRRRSRDSSEFLALLLPLSRLTS